MKNKIKLFNTVLRIAAIRKIAIIVIFTICVLTILDCAGSKGDIITPDTPAYKLVSKIKIGWNLGNSFDTVSGFFGNNIALSKMETEWDNPITTKENITAIKNAGFNAVRIPVTWHKVIDNNFNIRQDWMARITDVVNYAVDNDMYIILNTHHDEEIFKFTNANVEASLIAFKKIWEQIADNFKNYDEKLIFEALNEPRTKGNSVEWTGGNSEEHSNLNRHYQAFVNVVRASGGNNGKRILIVTPHGAKPIEAALNGFTLPNDTEPGRLIISVHSYQPEAFAFPVDEMPWATAATWNKNNRYDTSPITTPIDLIYKTFVSKGIPVIIGEFGAGNKNNIAARAEWAEFYVSYAKNKGIPCFLWDMGQAAQLAILNRSNNTFLFPEYVHALLRGASISGTPSIPVSNTITFSLNPINEGWQYPYRDRLLFSGSKIEQGKTYTFTYSFTTNINIDYLQVFFVDCNTTTNWAWYELSNHIKIKDNITANTTVNGSVEIIATRTAANTNSDANRVYFRAGQGTANTPVLTFTTFEIYCK
jgi:endoglucanase